MRSSSKLKKICTDYNVTASYDVVRNWIIIVSEKDFDIVVVESNKQSWSAAVGDAYAKLYGRPKVHSKNIDYFK